MEERVSFRQIDAVEGIPGNHDLITFFDVVHDSHDPLRLLQAPGSSLKEDGVCLILELNCHESLEENEGPIGHPDMRR